MQIKEVACVGAGTIGHSWATIFSSNGLRVTLQDRSRSALEKSMQRIESNLRFLESSNFMERGGTEAALRNIRTTSSLAEAISVADYVAESVPDTYPAKEEVFEEMDALAPAHAILASSSSGLLMTEIQKATTRPERCVLAHPVHPLYLIPLVEIVGGKKTSRKTVIATRDFMARLGKTPIVLSKEVPGYVVNRLQAALLRETISLVANGIASAEDVDRAFCTGIGLRDPIMGPCLRAYVAGGGIRSFIKNYDQSYGLRWKTMENWTSIPRATGKKFVESVDQMQAVRARTLDEIERLRDEKLVDILRTMLPEHPFL